jgi:hypothetical protein
MKARVLACRLALTFLIVVGLLFPSSVPNAKAYSTEITYGGQNLGQNNGTYARFTATGAGKMYYYAFIVGSHIGVYDELGALVRDIDLSSYCLEWVGSGGNSFIYPYNTTHALVVTDTYYAIYYSLLVKISTGTITVVGSWGSGTSNNALSLSPIFKYGTDYYVVYEKWTYSNDAVTQGIERIYPTVGAYSHTPTSSYLIRTPMFVIPSQDDNTVFYLLGSQSSTTHDLALATKRFRLVSLNFTDATLKGLGEGSFDYDWSNYTMMLACYYHNITSTNYIYDVLVTFPNLVSAKSIDTGLIRFNNTFLDDNAIQWQEKEDNGAGDLFLRPFGYSQGGNMYNHIDDGYIVVEYSGHSDKIFAFSLIMNNIETDTPYISADPDNMGFTQMEDDSVVHPYYASSGQIGGLRPPEWKIGIYIDYTNRKFKAEDGHSFAIWYFGIGGYQYSYLFTRDDVYGTPQSLSPVYVGVKYKLKTTWTYQGDPIVEGWVDVYWDNVWWKSVYMHYSVCEIAIEYTTSAQPSGMLKIVLTDKDRGFYNETHYYNQIVLSATTTSPDISGPGGPKDIKDYLPNFGWMIALLVCLTPGIFLGAKYGLFAGILGVAFGLGLTYVFPVINLPLALQAFVIVGMAFALFFGGHGWSAPKK